jgi:hypothetical protein
MGRGHFNAWKSLTIHTLAFFPQFHEKTAGYTQYLNRYMNMLKKIGGCCLSTLTMEGYHKFSHRGFAQEQEKKLRRQ